MNQVANTTTERAIPATEITIAIVEFAVAIMHQDLANVKLNYANDNAAGSLHETSLGRASDPMLAFPRAYAFRRPVKDEDIIKNNDRKCSRVRRKPNGELIRVKDGAPAARRKACLR